MSARVATVVTVIPTSLDGTTVRWYETLADAVSHNQLVSASRNGICARLVYADLDDWRAVLNVANRVAEQLRRDPKADVRHLATHEWDRLGAHRQLVAIERSAP